MTEEELKCDGWEPRLCRVGRLYFNEPYFCRLDGETVILFSITDDMHPIGHAKTLDDIKQLQMSHEAEQLKALENTLIMARQLFFEKYGNREKRSLTAKEILEDIKAVCNRRMDELWEKLPDAHIVEEDKYTRDDAFVTGQYNTLEEILRRIESMEKKSSDNSENEDVDEAARKWEDKTYLEKGYQDSYGTPHAPFSEIGNAFIAGAKWQEMKDNICYEEIFDEGVRWANERIGGVKWKKSDMLCHERTGTKDFAYYGNDTCKPCICMDGYYISLADLEHLPKEEENNEQDGN